MLLKKSPENEITEVTKQKSPSIEKTSAEKIDIIPDLSLPLRK